MQWIGFCHLGYAVDGVVSPWIYTGSGFVAHQNVRKVNYFRTTFYFRFGPN